MTKPAAAPLVSVVIPAFNAEATLRSTLQSALAQTYQPIEIIVVDDGSTDGTARLIDEFTAAHPRIRRITTTNAGVAAARNTGMEASSGKYVAPLDADDLWHPARVAEHVAALEAAADDTVVAYSPFAIIDADDRITGYSPVYRCDGEVFDFHLRDNLVGNGSSLTMLRAAALAVGGYPTFLREEGVQGCEDLFIQLKLAHAYRFISVPHVLIGYRKTNGNMSTGEARMLRSRIRVIRKMAELPGVTDRPAYYRALYDSCGLLITWLLYDEGRGPAFAELKRQVQGPADTVLVPLFAACHASMRGARRFAKRFLGPVRKPGAAGPRFSEWINS
jgi:glycosyltransferase involved in cell wall biosynthesis